MAETSGHGSKKKKGFIGKPRDAREYSQVMQEEKPTKNPLAAYIPFPDYSVEIQNPDEQLILLVRKHIVTNWKWVVIVIGMILMPLLLVNYPGFSLLPARFLLMTLVFWGLLVLAVALEGFLGWYFDVFIITDERVIDVDFVSMIYKNISTTQIDEIQDITMNISGPIPSLLNYGYIFVQTSAEVPEFSIAAAPNPQKVVKLLNELIMEEEQEVLDGRVR